MAMNNNLDNLNEIENENFHDASSSKTPASELHVSTLIIFDSISRQLRNINSIFDIWHPFSGRNSKHTSLHDVSTTTLLARHPPSATGKDDDIAKLKEILDDILVKTDHINMQKNHEKILFGPDNKIGITDPRYHGCVLVSIEDDEIVQEHITNKTIVGTKWETDFRLFMEKGKTDNATFALHVDMMAHSDEVCAIAFAERLGGEAGYNLLLSAVKTSLPFSFLKRASSYAAYCTKLLHEHFKSGPFYRRIITTLFTTPHKGSNVNFALDSQREMDHHQSRCFQGNHIRRNTNISYTKNVLNRHFK
ncbi:unnamed protein product [Mytilus edulis]|uniref:Uncharacterized protein n=1 Tax=Mytilus edulis TaxID=6550 RepID=A0A8S3QKX3_MYTED|nr:unnamed protein product [Mytilus edulis]